MKKILVIASLLLFAAACGKPAAQNSPQNQTSPTTQTKSPLNGGVAAQPNQTADTEVANQSYENKTYGFVFAYPKSYALLEASKAEDLGFYIPLQHYFSNSAGTTVVVTASMPKNEYPANTDFAGGFFNVSVNKSISEKDCSTFNTQTGIVLKGNINIGGTTFVKGIASDGAAGHQLNDEVFHAYHNGACFELQTGLRTEGLGAADSVTQHLDTAGAMRKLDMLLNTFGFTK